MTRRRKSPGLVTIYWRDIPAQVTATAPDGGTEKVLLPHRFQYAIDRAAAVAGLTDAHSYVEQWRRVHVPVDGDPQVAATSTAEALRVEYSPARLEELVTQGGLA